jgi:hypothetical protein
MPIEKKKIGRPTKYNQELADNICSAIVEGKSLRRIAKEFGFDLKSFFSWLRIHEGFLQQYARAKEEQAETFAEEIIEIADNGENDTYEDENGFTRTNHDVIARSRLRVDARKWVASKLKPKKYGDSTTLRGDNEAPLNPSVNLILNK